MKISMPCLRLASSGVTATCVKMFRISLSGYSKRASNSMSCLMFPSQNCKGESERGNHLNYKFCMVHWTNNWHWLELFEVIPGKKNMGFYGIKFQRSFKIGERSFKEKKNDHGNYFFWLISAIKAIISSSSKKRKKKGNYFIWLKNHYKLRNVMFTVFLQHIYNKL